MQMWVLSCFSQLPFFPKKLLTITIVKNWRVTAVGLRNYTFEKQLIKPMRNFFKIQLVTDEAPLRGAKLIYNNVMLLLDFPQKWCELEHQCYRQLCLVATTFMQI